MRPDEVQLALLLPFLEIEQCRPYLPLLAQAAWRQCAWEVDQVRGEPRDQLAAWPPLPANLSAGSDVEQVCQALADELVAGCRSIQTPLTLVSRPVRMYWLVCQGRRIQHAYAALERLLGSREQAFATLWQVVTQL